MAVAAAAERKVSSGNEDCIAAVASATEFDSNSAAVAAPHSSQINQDNNQKSSSFNKHLLALATEFDCNDQHHHHRLEA